MTEQLYMASCVATKMNDIPRTINHHPLALLAKSYNAAVEIAMLATKEILPIADGWRDHSVYVKKVPEKMLKNVTNVTPAHDKPACHIAECKNDADWSIWPHDDIYRIDIVCTDCVPNVIEAGKSYTIEPWDTELDEASIKMLLNRRIEQPTSFVV